MASVGLSLGSALKICCHRERRQIILPTPMLGMPTKDDIKIAV
jgi:hypothetical protein